MELEVSQTLSTDHALTNSVYCSTNDFLKLAKRYQAYESGQQQTEEKRLTIIPCFIRSPSREMIGTGGVKEMVYMLRADRSITDGELCMNSDQRDFMRLQLHSMVLVEPYSSLSSSFSEAHWNGFLLSRLTLKIASIGPKKRAKSSRGGPGSSNRNVPVREIKIDCDVLSEQVTGLFKNYVFVPSQRLYFRYAYRPEGVGDASGSRENILLLLEVSKVDTKSNDEVMMQNLNYRAKLTSDTQLCFYTERHSVGAASSSNVRLSLINAEKYLNKDIALGNISGGGLGSSSSSVSRLVGVDFEKMGIGGLDEEFTEIFRRAFASRIYPPEIVKKLGTKHVRGLMLYGPPGCGKTLIARQLSRILQGSQQETSDEDENYPEPKIVSGPEILNKYVGGSEEKIRELFKDAEESEKNYGEDSPLHVIIFDEIDAICRQRGGGGGGGDATGSNVTDSVVNQLLSKIDGVNSLNNILVIGMTNRLDIIDQALLRPGRFEVHIEITLPTEKGRNQILRIHTARMRENDVLDESVSLEKLAKTTKNFSGAELEGLVKSAASFAYLRHINETTMKKEETQPSAKKEGEVELKVKDEDFSLALKEVHPTFGVDKEEELEIYFRLNGILFYNSSMKILQETFNDLLKQVEHGNKTSLLSILLSGGIGSGKTAFASYLGYMSKFPFITLVSPDQFIGLSDHQKCRKLISIFEKAYKSPLSLIILDDIERLIEYVALGPRFSNSVLQALLVLINKQPPPTKKHTTTTDPGDKKEGTKDGHSETAADSTNPGKTDGTLSKLCVIGTTAIPHLLEDLGLNSVFNVKLNMPLISTVEEISCVLRETFKEEIDGSEIEKIALDLHGSFQGSQNGMGLSSIQELSIGQGMPVKKLLVIAEMSRQKASQQEKKVTYEMFMECVHNVGF